MKFRFYIIAMFDGRVFGTNDEVAADDFSEADEYVVIDTEFSKTRTSVGDFDVHEHGKD